MSVVSGHAPTVGARPGASSILIAYHQSMAATSLTRGRGRGRSSGVSRATLYAYVSRGLVASEPGPGPSRARRYPRAPLEALLRPPRAGARPRAGGPRRPPLGAAGARLGADADRGRAVLPTAGTTWSRSRAEQPSRRWPRCCGPATRSRPASCRPRGRRRRRGPPPRAAVGRRARAPPGGRRRRRSLVTLGAPDAVGLRGAARVVAGLFAAAGAGGRRPAGRAPGARVGHRPPRRALDAALVLCADHELNVSAVHRALRRVGRRRAWSSVVLAALCALRGRRHGGLTERVEDLVARRRRATGAAAPPSARWATSGGLPGFGHPLYPDGDPRAAAAAACAGRAPADPAGRRAAWRSPRDQLGLAAHARPRPGGAGARAAACRAGAALCLFALGRSAAGSRTRWRRARDDRLIRPRVALHRPAAAVGSSAP